MKSKTGDRGQRYEHRCKSGSKEMVIGWSDGRDSFSVMVKLHPSLSGHRVIDRKKR